MARADVRWAKIALLLAACGEPSGPDEARLAPLRREGLGALEVVERSEDGSASVVEGRRGGERCRVELTRGALGLQRVVACGPSEPIEVAERACEAGEDTRCAEVAARLRAEGTVDWPRATRASTRACEGGAPRECLYVGMAYELGGRGVPRDAEIAARMYARACEAGAVSACGRGGG